MVIYQFILHKKREVDFKSSEIINYFIHCLGELNMLLSDNKKKLFTIIITLFIAFFITYLPFHNVFSQDAIIMLAIAFIGAVFWITECIPIPLTALVIIVLQGVFGIQHIGDAISFIATPVNSLIFAGYVIATAFSKYDLDKRVSLEIISLMGEKTSKLILGIMISTAFLSMWISNTAATAIMIPISLGIISMENINKGESNLGKTMMLGIAYSANVGGMGTPAGTPASSITVAFLDDMAGIQISFLDWMIRAVPVVIFIIPLIWFVLCYIIYPLEIKRISGGVKKVKRELEEMGNLSFKQKHVFILFALSIVLWVSDSFLPLMSGWLYIASLLIILLFLTPVIGVVNWKETKNNIDWGIFILVGGGLALGSGLEQSGVIEILSTYMSITLEGANVFTIIGTIGLISSFSITLFSSLTATSSTFVPIAIALAVRFNMSVILLAMVAGLGACLAFLLPANTPPNAISYSYGYYNTYEMIKAGLPITVFSVIVLTLVKNIIWLLF